MNGGTCVDLMDNWRCICTDDRWRGRRCEIGMYNTLIYLHPKDYPSFVNSLIIVFFLSS